MTELQETSQVVGTLQQWQGLQCQELDELAAWHSNTELEEGVQRQCGLALEGILAGFAEAVP